MKGKKEELRIPMKFEEAVADLLKVKPPQKDSGVLAKEKRSMKRSGSRPGSVRKSKRARKRS